MVFAEVPKETRGKETYQSKATEFVLANLRIGEPSDRKRLDDAIENDKTAPVIKLMRSKYPEVSKKAVTYLLEHGLAVEVREFLFETDSKTRAVRDIAKGAAITWANDESNTDKVCLDLKSDVECCSSPRNSTVRRTLGNMMTLIEYTTNKKIRESAMDYLGQKIMVVGWNGADIIRGYANQVFPAPMEAVDYTNGGVFRKFVEIYPVRKEVIAYAEKLVKTGNLGGGAYWGGNCSG